MAADLTHMGGRVPDGQGHPAEGDRRQAAAEAEHRVQVAALVFVDALAAGDEGGALRHLNALEHDPAAGVNPWRLVEAAAKRAPRAGSGTLQGG